MPHPQIVLSLDIRNFVVLLRKLKNLCFTRSLHGYLKHFAIGCVTPREQLDASRLVYLICDLDGYLGITRSCHSIVNFLCVSSTRACHSQGRYEMFEHYGFTGAWSTCFTTCKCWWCRQSSVANFPDFPCFSCGNKQFANVQSGTMVARHFEKNLNIPTCTTRLTIEYMYMHNPVAEFRRQYFLNVALVEGSRVRVLSYYYNGIHGNISQCDHIIDRILIFVKGRSRLGGSITTYAAWFALLNCQALALVSRQR